MKTPVRSPRASHDRWLVSYADLVTLLFAFFTTLYAAGAVTGKSHETATSSTDNFRDGRPRMDAVPRPAALESGGGVIVALGDAPATSVTTTAPGDAAARVDALAERLSAQLENDVRLQRADILRDGRGLVVSLPERATFAVGSADVSADARPLIARVVNELAEGQYALRIEGHTDDVPIRTAKYPSNWELSTARAGAVVAYLIKDLRFPADRLSAAGYGEFHPRVANDSAANRAVNRRIDIVVLPLAGAADHESLPQ